MRKSLVGIVFAFVALPLFASAATVEELRAQITELLSRIEALQVQIGGSPAGTPVTGGSIVPPATAINPATVTCPHVSRVLKRGMSGDDVTRLQRFLSLDPSVYPEAQVSGYYGALTEAAIKRFQCKNKLVCEGTAESTGYGVAGPRTAALLALQCPDILGGSGGNVGGFIKVTPITGAAPLPVSVEATVNTTKSCTAATYEVDFGDGTPSAQIVVPSNACSELRQIFNHTYRGGGTFIIALRSGVHRTTATVTVSGAPSPTNPTADSLSVTPTSGNTPLNVTFTGVINVAAACNAGPYELEFGDGQSVPLAITGCAPNAYTVTHAYTTNGNFVARLLRSSVAVGSATLNVGGSSGGGGGYGAFFSVAPGIGGDNRPSAVTVQFDIASSCTAYDVDWGDGTSHATQAQGSCGAGAVTREFTHEYDNSGSYEIVLRRGDGLSATDTAGITISE